MKRTAITLLILLAIAGVNTTGILADNPHFTRGPNFWDNGLTATGTGRISGLGNGDVIITISFPNATGTTTCTNRGGNQAPGQNPGTPTSVSGTITITSVRNGTVTFSVTTNPPLNPDPVLAGCPNANWSAVFNDITFGVGTLTVQQETFHGSGVFETVLVSNVVLGDPTA
jgi:hypothetical protein